MHPLDVGLRALLAVVFATAVIGKARNRSAFAEFAATLVPLVGGRRAATAAAVGVVLAELLAVATLIGFPRFGYAIAAATLTVLAAGVRLALRRGLLVGCACFGAGGAVLSTGHVVRNLALAAVALAGLALHAWHPLDAGALDAGLTASAVVAGAVAGWCVTRWDDLAALMK